MKKWIFFCLLLIVPAVIFAQGDGDAPGWTNWIAYAIGAIGTLFGGTKIITWIKNLLKTKSAAMVLVGKELVEWMKEATDVTREGKEAIVAIEAIVNGPTPTPAQIQGVLKEIKDVLREMKDVPQASRELTDAAVAVFTKS